VRLSALDRKLLRELWQMKSQVLAIAAVIMGGVATLVMSLSTYDSLARTRDRFYADYRLADVFVSLKRAPEAVADRLREIPGIYLVETRVVTGVKLEVEGFAEPVTGLVLSLPDGARPLLNDLHLRRGRLPEAGRSEEVVISDTFADAHHFEPGDRLSAIIRGHHQTLTIVGIAVSPEYVYQIAPGAMFPDFKRYGVMWISRSALAAATDMEGAFNQVSALVLPGTPLEAVLDGLDAVLGRWGGKGAYGRKDQFSNHFLSQELKQLKTTATVFPAIFLGVAAFLLNVVLSRLIALQRTQIGILKAFGHSHHAIAWHYVKFVLVVVTLGVAMGVGLGAWFGESLSRVYQETTFRFPYLDYVLQPQVVAIAFLVGLLAAVGGTLLGLARVVRLPPAQALLPEAPPSYRTTLMERLGLSRLGTSSRMILRHIARRPVKSALTVLGIACACGLMMVGNYQKAAIDFIVEIQFHRAAREDLSLTFIDPTASRALFELAALPGVTHVEGFRDVPAILRFRNHRHRGAVFGIQPDGVLHRALDVKLNPVSVPEGGIVLTDHLARNIVHVQPGDVLTVEVLEGRRRTLEVPVLGITRQFLGLSAYMQQASLNALLGEGPVVTGAYLALEPGREAEVYAALNARPRVLGMVVHAAAIRSFYATIGEFVLFYTLVATLLAGAIGFGVVYNSARIALSERERELASLRVLGFTQGEIGYILLGELALLALLAIPVGMAVGVGLVGILVLALQSDLYRLPLILRPDNYAMGALVVVVSAMVSGLIVWRRLGRLDLLAALKTRE
jgi:putative ABC transport system permease protein